MKLGLKTYSTYLEDTCSWLEASRSNGNGGSSAYFSPLTGWSKPYPETSGYLVPTLLKLSDYLSEDSLAQSANQLGTWLLSIQNGDGSWNGGLHPDSKARPSVFNTGQILKGMCALYEHSGDQKYLSAASHGAQWLAQSLSKQGLWPSGDYRSGETPSYYTHVAWPMLEVWHLTSDTNVHDAALKFLGVVLSRRRDNGTFSDWGFQPERAVTHTIAYTIRGLQECARLLDAYEEFGSPVEQALNTLCMKAERSNGRLPGEFDDQWQATARYVCLTGNAQLAICLLLLESRESDMRLVNAAAKLIDFVVGVQRHRSPLKGVRGAVAGSYPLWGRYMVMRYPNWAAKYFCDALMLLEQRLLAETNT